MDFYIFVVGYALLTLKSPFSCVFPRVVLMHEIAFASREGETIPMSAISSLICYCESLD